ncbi:MAG: hypothetical protein DHS20C18_30840 [Saprospiraceae bacterium]|nr:MAG: hypothetical protein DHS20C18_30840 [Saprospiraceae bacterium]
MQDTVVIDFNSTFTFDVEISDLVNNNMAAADQGLCGVELHFIHSFSENLEISLTSPGGQTINLIGPNTNDPVAFTFFAKWKITFVPCGDTPQPDPGYLAQWNNDQPNNFDNGGQYSGSYHPYIGCLEDFNTGPANGTWQFTVTNNPSNYEGFFPFVRLIFCDSRGVDCCFAKAGALTNPDLLTCEGDSSLIMDITPVYSGSPADTSEYDYQYLIGADSILVAIDSLIDLTSYAPGTYQICGISYKTEETDSLPVPDGLLTIDSLRDNLNSFEQLFCGEVSDSCIWVTIVAPPATIDLVERICEGDTLMVGDSMLTATGNYAILLDSYAGCDSIVNVDLTVAPIPVINLVESICEGDSVIVGSRTYFASGNYSDTLTTADLGCDSIVNLDLTVRPILYESIDTTICAGDSFMVGDSIFTLAGNYEVILTSSLNCDSVVTLNLQLLSVSAVIALPDTIDCYNNGITLDGSASQPTGQVTYRWLDMNGGSLGSNATLSVIETDTIILEVEAQQDGVACIDRDTVVVFENTLEPIAYAGEDSTLNCNISQLTLGGPPTSFGPEYTYLWTTLSGNITGSPTQLQVQVNGAGDYELLVTNTLNGCTAQDTVNITIDTIAPIADAGLDTVLTCRYPSIQLNGNGSSIGPEFIYNWTSLDTGVPTNQSTLTPTVDQEGTYQLIVTDTLNGCLDTAFVLVGLDIIAPQAIIAQPDTLNCAIQTQTLDASATVIDPNFEFYWNLYDGANIQTGATTLNPLIDATGIYQLVVVNQYSGCRDSLQVIVVDSVNVMLSMIDGDTLLTCENPSLTLSAMGSTQLANVVYCWSTSDGHFVADSIGFTTEINASGTYQLIVKDTFTQCADTTFQLVTIDQEIPMAETNVGFTLNCVVESDTLFGQGSSQGTQYLYQWTGPCIDTDATDLDIIVSCPGWYYLEVRDTLTGCLAVDSVAVLTNNEVPNAIIEPPAQLSCAQVEINLEAINSTPFDSLDFQWTGPGIVSGATTEVLTINAGGTYTLIVTNRFSACADTTQIEVEADTISPLADAGTDQILDCNVDLAELGGPNTSQGFEFSYSWTTVTGHIVSPTNESVVTVDSGGLYILEVLNTINGCRDTDLVDVIGAFAPPFTDAGPNRTIDCAQTSVWLDGSESDTTLDLSIKWTGPCLLGVTDSIFAEVGCVGVYTLNLTNLETGCQGRDSVEVLLNANAPLAVLPDTIPISCVTGSAILNGTGSTSGVYEWLYEDQPTTLAGIMPTVDQSGRYTLIVFNQAQTCSDTATVIVTEDCGPDIIVVSIDTITCDQSIATIDASASPQGPQFTYLWTGPDPACFVSPVNGPIVQVTCPGLYTLVLTNTAIQSQATRVIEVVANDEVPVAEAGLPDAINCLQALVTLDGTGSSTGNNIVYFWTSISLDDTIGFDLILNDISIPGTYALEVMDTVTQCQGTDFVQIRLDTIAPIVNFGNNLFPCLVDSFDLEVFPSPASATYTYDWTGPGLNGVVTTDTSVININSLGLFTITITNTVSGCSGDNSVLVIDQTCAPCIIVATPDTLSCNQESVVLEAEFCDLCIGCTLSWTTSDGNIVSGGDSLTPTVDSAGTYILTATDLLGFTSTQEVVVIALRDPPPANAGPDRKLTCDSISVSLGMANLPANPDYSYAWSSANGSLPLPADGPVATVNAVDDYFLEVTNNLTGCVGFDTVLVTYDTLSPTANAGPDRDLTCTNPLVVLDGSGSTVSGPLTYLWTTTNGPGCIQGINTLTPVVSCPGLYTLQVSNNLNGCRDTSSVTVNLAEELPTIDSIAGGNINCRDSVVTLTGNIPAPTGYSFQWCPLDGNGDPISAECLDELVFEAAIAGNYRFQVTEDATGCTSSRTIVVGMDTEAPEVDAGLMGTLFCTQDSLILGGTVGPDPNILTYIWSAANDVPISNPASLNPTIYFPDTFYLTVTNTLNFCVGIDSVIIAQDVNTPEAEAGPDTLLSCAQPIMNLQGSGTSVNGSVQFQWSTIEGNIVGSTTIANPQVNAPGWYFLTVVDPVNNCTSFPDSVLVSGDNQAPTAMIAGLDTLELTCQLDTVMIDATASLAPSGEALSYQWIVMGNGHLFENLTDSIVFSDAAGEYRLIVTDGQNGCTDTLDFILQANDDFPLINYLPPNDFTCELNSVTIDASGSDQGPNYLIQWLDENDTVLLEDSLQLTVTAPGDYTLLIRDLINGCTSTEEIRVAADQDVPVVSILEPDLLDCDQPSAVLDGSNSSQGFRYLYQWTTVGGQLLSGQDSIIAEAGGAGIYILNVLDTLSGCSAADSTEVMALAAPIIGLIVDIMPPPCIGDQFGSFVIDSVMGGTPDFQFSFDGNSLSTQTAYNNLIPGEYPLLVVDSQGCEWEETIGIPGAEDLVVDLGPDITVTIGDSMRLEALVNRDSVQFRWWSTEVIEDPTNPIQYVSPPIQTTYYVEVTDENGCKATDFVIVYVEKPDTYFIPTAFSPNGDGQNDLLVLYTGKEVDEILTFQIFDRWGNMVYGRESFQANDPTFGWDGNFEGQPLNTAVFVYYVEMQMIDGRIEVVKGDVVLLR